MKRLTFYLGMFAAVYIGILLVILPTSLDEPGIATVSAAVFTIATLVAAAIAGALKGAFQKRRAKRD